VLPGNAVCGGAFEGWRRGGGGPAAPGEDTWLAAFSSAAPVAAYAAAAPAGGAVGIVGGGAAPACACAAASDRSGGGRFVLAGAVVAEAGLSFLGLGAQPPLALQRSAEPVTQHRHARRRDGEHLAPTVRRVVAHRDQALRGEFEGRPADLAVIERGHPRHRARGGGAEAVQHHQHPPLPAG
jgi:hypothetical protein